MIVGLSYRHCLARNVFHRGLPVYVSPVLDPEAWGVNALSFPWGNLLADAFPPFSFGKVICIACKEGATLILIASNWEAQSWFPDLLSLVLLDQVPLRLKGRALIQPRSGIPHGNPEILIFTPGFCGAGVVSAVSVGRHHRPC